MIKDQQIKENIHKLDSRQQIDLEAYFTRINVPYDPRNFQPNLKHLELITVNHIRSIPFETCDVVCGKTISIESMHVFQKLVYNKRGGYCFEHNKLMEDILLKLGYDVKPYLLRVRINKPIDYVGHSGHTALRVRFKDIEEDILTTSDNSIEKTSSSSSSSSTTSPCSSVQSPSSPSLSIRTKDYFVDAGFGGPSPQQPIPLINNRVIETNTEVYRFLYSNICGNIIIENESKNESKNESNGSGKGIYRLLQFKTKSSNNWKSLYLFKDDVVDHTDLEMSNWWSCTNPQARFVTSMFVGFSIDRTYHSIHNEIYSIRNIDTGETIRSIIKNKKELLLLLTDVFGIVLPPNDSDGIDRYLPMSSDTNTPLVVTTTDITDMNEASLSDQSKIKRMKSK